MASRVAEGDRTRGSGVGLRGVDQDDLDVLDADDINGREIADLGTVTRFDAHAAHVGRICPRHQIGVPCGIERDPLASFHGGAGRADVGPDRQRAVVVDEPACQRDEASRAVRFGERSRAPCRLPPCSVGSPGLPQRMRKLTRSRPMSEPRACWRGPRGTFYLGGVGDTTLGIPRYPPSPEPFTACVLPPVGALAPGSLPR